ncbi:hypothetical protein [Paenibacillus camerounensis]|uniref:hypothetical protein n=1 Tax=Paenibacillus camerounensis TaxID=1243663 RepID=UPI000A4E9E4F|nr:hypothetical protein [Paenibacillus camerounensis]
MTDDKKALYYHLNSHYLFAAGRPQAEQANVGVKKEAEVLFFCGDIDNDYQ